MNVDARTLPLTVRCPNQAIEFTLAGRITGSLAENGQRGLTPVTRHLYTQTQGMRKQETECLARPAWRQTLFQLAWQGIQLQEEPESTTSHPQAAKG